MRDRIMGIPCSDMDVTTSALPEEMLEVFKDYRVIPTGIKHGTVTVLMPEPVEVTTYRVDGSYSDSRHPDSVSFTRSLREDLARRDLTVNAIAYHPELGYIDPFGGMEDIKRGVIRAVGDPERRFSEDALRILRAVRFCSSLDFTMDDATARAAESMAWRLDGVSPERKYVELVKTLMGKGVRRALTQYSQVISAVIPELKKCIGFDQKSRHHDFDLYTHIAIAVSQCPRHAELRLAALLHDIAKPDCFYSDERGGHFPEHAQKSAEMAEGILRRLRADNSTVKAVVGWIKHHRDIPKSDAELKRMLCKLSPEGAERLLELMMADSAAKKAGAGVSRELLNKRRRMEQIIKSGECYSLRGLDIDGDILIEAGYCGKEIGRALQLALDAVIEDKIKNDRREIEKYLKGMLSNGK